VVIADNCTDDTAAVAEAAGARVLVRDVPDVRGKGQALRWALDRELAAADPPDAVAVVDADSAAAPDFLEALVAPLADGARAAQGESLLRDDGTTQSVLRAAAFLLVNRVRPSGRAVLGAPCHLAGNGMLLRRDVLEEVPWNAFTSAEDLEYALRLRAQGIGPVFARGAILLSPTAPTREAAVQQQLRWEGGKVHLARVWIPRLLRDALRSRRLGLLDAALELAIPPLGLVAAGTTLGLVLAAVLALVSAAPVWALVPWVVAAVAIPVYVVAGLAAGRAPAAAYRALAAAPILVARKLPHLGRLLRFRGDTWVRTERGE
jgi:Glycosyltransferase like family 2